MPVYVSAAKLNMLTYLKALISLLTHNGYITKATIGTIKQIVVFFELAVSSLTPSLFIVYSKSWVIII